MLSLKKNEHLLLVTRVKTLKVPSISFLCSIFQSIFNASSIHCFFIFWESVDLLKFKIFLSLYSLLPNYLHLCRSLEAFLKCLIICRFLLIINNGELRSWVGTLSAGVTLSFLLYKMAYKDIFWGIPNVSYLWFINWKRLRISEFNIQCANGHSVPWFC